jgi:regulator of sirC expression with transglutaminase-like and TPR domain
MEDLPNDVRKHMCTYLTDDGISIGRFSLCSKGLHESIINNRTLWKELYHKQWRYSVKELDENTADYRKEYLHRFQIDQLTTSVIQDVARDLKSLPFNYEDPNKKFFDESPHVGQAWNNDSWKALMAYRIDVVDVLKRISAQREGTHSTDEKMQGFLAARALVSLRLNEGLFTWKEISEQEEQLQRNMTSGDELRQAQQLLLERFALLICQIQQTPPEILREEKMDVSEVVTQQLDAIAANCRTRMVDATNISKKLQVVNTVLFDEMRFVGNDLDYYNYRNSLLNKVLETKKGIPITLCILYSCICRRLGLHVHLVGLPGHVVLGFLEEDGSQKFLDIFRRGRILGLEDCQSICASYGFSWNHMFTRAITAAEVLHRTLNNLANCHGQANIFRYKEELCFQQRTLMMIHRQPAGVASRNLLEQVSQELPLTLLPDLLQWYGLLS